MLPGTLVASIVGHIPKEISRYTRHIVEHGASVDAFVLATHHRPSPLIQGGLEIPFKVIHFSTMMSNQSSTWKTTTPIKLDIT